MGFLLTPLRHNSDLLSQYPQFPFFFLRLAAIIRAVPTSLIRF
jgi:hypothetical protein